MAASCVMSAAKINAGGIVVIGDKTGDITRLVSKYRPHMPILMIADTVKVAKQLTIHRSVYPTMLPHAQAMSAAVKQGLMDKGDVVVVLNAAGANGIEMTISQVA